MKHQVDQIQDRHCTVLLERSVELLITDSDGIYIDGTFGRGGHSRALLAHLGSKAHLLAFDKDPQALEVGKEIAQHDSRFSIVHQTFANLGTVVEQRGWLGKVNGILLDLGVSSPQLDDPARGFSFMQDGPLDMRMNNIQGQTAAQWLNTAQAAEISEVLKRYGDERFHRRIAQAVVQERIEQPMQTTRQFADLVARACPVHDKHKHPATRSFQAVRIFINRELEDLENVLQGAMQALAIGGRLAVISFHSLEDRIVKNFIRDQEKGPELPRGLPVREADYSRRLKSIVKAEKPDDGEIDRNPRARSAVFRVAEKLV